MFHQKDRTLVFALIIIASLVLAACQSTETSTPQTIIETVVVTQEVAEETVVQVVTATPEPTPTSEPSGPRTLVYCMVVEPTTLYLYEGSKLATSLVLEAIYDGPIDNRSFDYQPVILEKVPSLADSDALLEPVAVASGDRVVDAGGSPVPLTAGVRVRPSGCQSGGCAVEYDGSSPLTMDQLVVTFRLLPGLLWSDGTPLTAHDSVYAFNLAADPDTPDSGETKKSVIERTGSYQALDDLTVEWTGLPGYLASTYNTNFWIPLPEHAWGGFSAAELLTADESTRQPLGWGPYVIDELNEGDSIRLRRNERYFRASEGLPRFTNLVFRFKTAATNQALIASLLSGECDILSIGTDFSQEGELLLELNNTGQLNAAFVAGTRWEHADFGIVPASYDDGWGAGDRPDFFGDVRTRRAIASCIDRQGMAESIIFGQSVLLDTYLPPQHPLFNPDVARYPFDVAAGSALLDEVGWVMGQDGVRVYAGDNPRIPLGTRFSFQYNTNSIGEQAAFQILTDSLASCGIEVSITYWNNPEQYFGDGPEGPLFGRKFDMSQFRWSTEVEPPCELYLTEQIPGPPEQGFPLGWGGPNLTGYSNPEYDAVCRATLNSLPGQPGYVENHLRAQEIFAEDLPVVPLFVRPKVGATRPDFCNYLIDPTENGDTWNIEAFDYGEGCG